MKITCPKCNRSADVDDTFAGKSVKCACGERFIAPIIKENVPDSVQVQEAVTSSPIRKSMECPHCGYVMDAFTLECPRCKVYESAGTQPRQYKQSPQPVTNESPHKTQFRCQQCGEQLPEGALDCPTCSSKVKISDTPISADRIDSSVSERVNLPKAKSPLLLVGSVIGFLVVMIGFAVVYGIRHNPAQGSLQGQVFIVTKGGENIKLGLVTINLYSYDDISSYVTKRKSEYVDLVNKEKQIVDLAKTAKDNARQNSDNASTKSGQALDAYLKLNYDDPNGPMLDAKHNQALDDYTRALEASNSANKSYREAVKQSEDALSGSFFFENLPTPIRITQTDADGKFTLQLPVDGQYVIAAQAQRDVADSTEYYYWMNQVSLDGTPSKSTMLSNNNLSNAHSPDSLIDTVY